MKIKILKNGDFKKIIGTKYFVVSNDFSFLLNLYGKKYLINVPKGFVTDFGSIPPVFFFFDKTKYASYIMHDYLYSFIGKIVNINGELDYDQTLADDILVAGLKYEGMIESGRISVFIGLSIGGRFNFKKKNKEIIMIKNSLNCN